MDKLQTNEPMEDPLDVLNEWFEWWRESDDAPAKMPMALHVRTALLLTQMGKIRPPQAAASITLLPTPMTQEQ